MSKYGDFILNVSMVSATIWIVNKFLQIFFEKKNKNTLTIILWMFFGVFQVIFEYNKGNASIWTTIISIIIVVLITNWGYNGSLKSKIAYVILFYVVWSILEMFVYFCMQSTSIRDNRSVIIGAVISKIVAFILINVLSMFWRKNDVNDIAITVYLILLFIPIGSIYIAVNEFFKEVGVVSSLIVFSILILINIIIFEIYSKLSENFKLEKEKAIYAQLVSAMSRSTEEQKKIMEEFYQEKHNLTNQLITLKESIEQCDRNNMVENLDNIINSYHTVASISDSGNNIIDAIINFKYTFAKKQGIDFYLKIFIPEKLPINQCDLGIIIGNAIDNAIESTQECISSKKIISILMRVKKGEFVIVIKNPYEHSLRKNGIGKLLSTKEEYSRHGYGVNSLERIAKQYDGEVLVETTDNIFSLTVIMNLGNFDRE